MDWDGKGRRTTDVSKSVMIVGYAHSESLKGNVA